MTALASVDLNADVGEASDPAGIAIERALLSVVSSVHVACGGHAGDARSMRDTITAAHDAGVSVGAHPSYPDRAGFGRRPMALSPDQLESALVHQLDALMAACHELGAPVHSVKPHGALYAEVGRGGPALDALRRALRASCPPDTPLVLQAGSAAVGECRSSGQPVWTEGFCDRSYADDGTLVDRSVAGSVYDDPEQAARQAVRLAQRGDVDTLCLHGDSPGADAMARAVRRALEAAGLAVMAPARRQ